MLKNNQDTINIEMGTTQMEKRDKGKDDQEEENKNKLATSILNTYTHNTAK